MYRHANKLVTVLLRICLLALLSYFATVAIVTNDGIIPPQMWCLTAGCCTVLVGYFLTPFDAMSRNIVILPAWNGLVTLLAYGMFLSYPGQLLIEWKTVSLGFGIFVLSCLIGCAHIACNRYVKNRHITLSLVITLLIFFALAPIWLSPLAKLFGDRQQLVNSIINISPISYLAIMTDYDYLRSAWFYQHTPYGGLRYTYLSPMLSSFYYLSVWGLALIIFKYKTTRTPPDDLTISNLNKQTKHQGAYG